MTIADSGLRTAQGRHAEFTSPSDRTVALAQDQVDITQAISDSAQETFNELQKPSQSVISLAQKNVAAAEAALAAAEAQANYEINSAQSELESASTQLDDLKTPRLAQLAAAKAAVVAAEQILISTQKSNAQHRIQAAQAKVNQVEQQLAETRVLAPFDGVVTKIWLSIGAIASPRPMIPVATVASKDVYLGTQVKVAETTSQLHYDLRAWRVFDDVLDDDLANGDVPGIQNGFIGAPQLPGPIAECQRVHVIKVVGISASGSVFTTHFECGVHRIELDFRLI